MNATEDDQPLGESPELPFPHRRTVYISGPMTGLPGLNFDAFHAKAAELRAEGVAVLNPVTNGVPYYASRETHMRADLRMLLDCNEIHMLPGWQQSQGALIEYAVAKELGMTIHGALQ